MRKLQFLVVTAVALLALGVTAAQATPPSTRTAPVFWLDSGTPVPGASSTTLRSDGLMNFSLNTSGLGVGHAFTLWLVIFNDPLACAIPHQCTLSDLDVNRDSVIWGAGRVIGGQGTANFAGHISENNVERPSSLPNLCPDPIGEGACQRLFGPGLTDARGADVFFVVRDHFEAQPGILNQQIHSFGVGCPNAACIDQQGSYNTGF